MKTDADNFDAPDNPNLLDPLDPLDQLDQLDRMIRDLPEQSAPASALEGAIARHGNERSAKVVVGPWKALLPLAAGLLLFGLLLALLPRFGSDPAPTTAADPAAVEPSPSSPALAKGGATSPRIEQIRRLRSRLGGDRPTLAGLPQFTSLGARHARSSTSTTP